jgi:DNA/RNA endonuclease YhcR with UshA esterase domain
MKNLKVNSAYVTQTGESKGAMTLDCTAEDGTKIEIRTIVLLENGVLVTPDRFIGKTIDVKGFVDFYSGSYQIKVFSANDIVVH